MASPDDEFPAVGAGRLRWPLLAFLAVFLAATLAAALLTPPVHRLLVRSAAHSPFAAHVLAKPLAKLIDRLRWPFLALGLLWLVRGTDRRSWFRPAGHLFSHFFLGCSLGLLAHGPMLLAADWHLRPLSPAVPLALAAAPIVAILEEVVFRGLLFRSAERVLGTVAGAIASSLFFACVHFRVAPGAPPMGSLESISLPLALHSSWELLTAFWTNFRPVPFLSLFLLGLLLCRWARRFRSLLPAIGFHWGIVSIALPFRRLIALGPFGGSPIDSPLCPLLLCLLLIRDRRCHGS
ncbi:MAG: CPBP family intramembrane metalloprotease [Puniceicoccales bacterium]|jgi:membrane protease YdiL (CAAX protease family)|nr:CPBP family intramembrane metalloprotease [Puniceicoccales bacterium]